MRNVWTWLGAATLMVLCSAVERAEAGTQDPLKPYVVLVLDTSGSMDQATGSGSPSCGGPDTKLNHARCAINKIVNTYGEMVFAFGRFRSVSGGTTTGATFPTGCTVAGPGDTGGITCNATDDMFEMFTALVDGQNSSTAVWTNGTGNTCTAAGTDPEVWEATGNTPLEGVLNGAKDYWVGKQETDYTVWPAASAGFSPIFNDPTRDVFLPTGCNPSPTCTTNCCASQCRPYITILLTDGAETCGGHAANAGTGADALLKSDVGACKNNTTIQCTTNAQCTTGTGDTCVLKRYHIITHPIGFGISDPDTSIEAIAHAGGTPDGAGDEGYYVTNEADLELAFSKILAGSVRTEVCNGVDDDCDTKVDEGFNKGATCNNGELGACFRTGTTVCSADGTGVVCNAPTITGVAETCNGIDDDCDGKIDEGLASCNCVVMGETCDNNDNDCDGKIDEGITRACGTGTCQGIETCSAGVFGGCTAKTPTTEICNGVDDDCDGVIDGITQACSTMPATGGHPAGDPRNNPAGDPTSACAMEGPSICVCRDGSQNCPAGGGGVFGACSGEVKPGVEICNGLDDDCDGKIDEGTGGQDCSTNCGIGTTVCTGGVISCNGTTAGTDDTCDGHDDDCDGQIDEDWVSPGACGNGVVCNGMEKCVNGTPTCIGDPIGTESCNCLDDDCDGTVDENVACPNGSTCTNCQCAFPCAAGEFPCPLGKACVNNFCVADPCYQKDCPPVGGHRQECQVQGNAGVCVDSCRMGTAAGDNCADPMRCKYDTGECLPNNCSAFPDLCAADQVCVNNVCTSNPCAGVNCTPPQYCVGTTGGGAGTGTCVSSCAGVTCDAGMRCQLGTCVDDPCGKPCPGNQVCQDSTGTCQDNPCDQVLCPSGESCDPHGDGTCSPDPCVGTTCPDPSQVCIRGTCDVPPAVFTPDGEPEQHVTTGGGGGCNTGGDGGLLVGLGVVALAIARRKGVRA